MEQRVTSIGLAYQFITEALQRTSKCPVNVGITNITDGIPFITGAQVTRCIESAMLPKPNMTARLQFLDDKAISLIENSLVKNSRNSEGIIPMPLLTIFIYGTLNGDLRIARINTDCIVDINAMNKTIDIIVGGTEEDARRQDNPIIEIKEKRDPSFERFRNILED